MIERMVQSDSPDDDIQEQELEITLRPRDFANYIGQERLVRNLKLAIAAAKKRGEPVDHVLLYGPPGLGKTTTASVIAHEMGANIRITSGPAIERAGDLASLLTNLKDGDILFIDEIHRLHRSVEEVLYSAMEDFKLDIMLGKGPSARSLRLDLPKFTLIGATTRTGALAAPLRDRFGLQHRLEFYTRAEIAQIIMRAASILKVKISQEAAEYLAERARLTPRIANRLLKRVRDYADVNGDGIIDQNITNQALALLEIDALGLDPADRRVLEVVIEHYDGGPVGLDTIAALTGDERTTIEDFYEPYMMQIGLLERTPRGRKVTSRAYSHLLGSRATPNSHDKSTRAKNVLSEKNTSGEEKPSASATKVTRPKDKEVPRNPSSGKKRDDKQKRLI
ncbi:Holliday junction branch migration DNA helicase RuvB [Candidatus Saccharibacteria bacterium]|nr:Holliday junction branch migration DNA helicase RuvB [Candidatus Saccharibacteria bacterium]MBI3338222.1 Holliday junction branch migration DNA helicase RuvB [Candidatus Saccharibacteria bacterium]